MSTLLDDLINARFYQVAGVQQTRRATINFAGDVSVSHDEIAGVMTLTFAAASAPASTTVRVDKAGNDATGSRGGSPYLTIAAALAAAQSGDTVEIGTGTWTEAVTLPDVASLCIRGQGLATVITQASADATVGRSSSETLSTLTLQDLVVYNTKGSGTAHAIALTGVDASGYATGSSDMIRLRGVFAVGGVASSGVLLQCVGNARIEGCVVSGALVCKEVASARIYDTTATTWTAQWTVTENLPGSSTSASITADGLRVSGTTTLTDVVRVTLGGGCELADVDGDLDANATGTHGLLTASCRMGSVDLTTSYTVDAAVGTLDGSTMTSLTVAALSTGGASCSALGCVVTGDVTAGNDSEVYLGNSSYGGLASDGATPGKINRARTVQAVSLSIGSNEPSWAVPFASAPTAALVQTTTSGVDPYVTALNASGIAVVAAAVDSGAKVIVFQE